MRGISWLSRPGAARKLAAVGKDEQGTTAVEFAMVATPFLFLLFGIMSVGFYFFVVFALENAVETASRVIRTGQAQTQTPSVMTVDEFKTRVCDNLPAFMNCSGANSKIRVHVQNFTGGYSSITTPQCIDSGTNLLSNTQTWNMGGASSIVLVTVCFEWDLTQAMAGVAYWITPPGTAMGNGSTLIMASTTFTTEPYN